MATVSTMPPRKDVLREAVSQIMCACSGETDQIEQTLDTVIGAVETYLFQLLVVAVQNGSTPDKVKPDDIFDALKGDPAKHDFVDQQFKKFQDAKKEKRQLTQY
jgi:hypothetical protein